MQKFIDECNVSCFLSVRSWADGQSYKQQILQIVRNLQNARQISYSSASSSSGHSERNLVLTLPSLLGPGRLLNHCPVAYVFVDGQTDGIWLRGLKRQQLMRRSWDWITAEKTEMHPLTSLPPPNGPPPRQDWKHTDDKWTHGHTH